MLITRTAATNISNLEQTYPNFTYRSRLLTLKLRRQMNVDFPLQQVTLTSVDVAKISVIVLIAVSLTLYMCLAGRKRQYEYDFADPFEHVERPQQPPQQPPDDEINNQ